MVKVQKMVSKNKCADIFFELDKTIAKKDFKKFLKYKYAKNNSESLYSKLRLLLTLKAIRGELYIRILLKSIEL
jgi:hypothetical protein